MRTAMIAICLLVTTTVIAAPHTFNDDINLQDREMSRQFYLLAYMASSNKDAQWQGDISGCIAGTTHDDYVFSTLRRVNWFRAMSGVPASIYLNESASIKATEAALMMSANNTLSHYPSPSWRCYTQEGNEAASKSNLSIGYAGAESVTGQFEDHGSHNTAVGHRRWLQYPIIPSIGIGNVLPSSGYAPASAVWVMDWLDLPQWWRIEPDMRDGFVAWPPPGYVPYTTVYPRWSFSYPDADFSNAQVTMMLEGESIPVTLESTEPGAGLNTIVWIPYPYADFDRWDKPNQDTVYQVSINQVMINGQSSRFDYDVTVFDPYVSVHESYQDLLFINGEDNFAINEPVELHIEGLKWADEYLWNLAEVAAFDDTFTGQSSFEGIEVSISNGYTVLNSSRKVSAPNSYHLAHPSPTDQTISLISELVPSDNASLSFDSYLGWATDRQVALVEVSADSLSWTTIWESAGAGAPVSHDFSNVVVDLSGFAHKSIHVRFRYAFLGDGSYYPQTSDTVGWFIDNVDFSGVQQILSTTDIESSKNTSLLYQSDVQGEFVLRVRPILFGGFFGQWSQVKHVSVSDQIWQVPNLRRSRGLPIWLYVIE